jgi:8-oxo-dGTP diphosphatase
MVQSTPPAAFARRRESGHRACYTAGLSGFMTIVAAALIEREGRLLVCRRRATDPHPLKWEFPGGKAEPAEPPREALRRELEEELGIEARIGREVARYEFAYAGKKPILLIFFQVREFEGELTNRVFEQIRWEAPHALPSYDFLEGDIEFVRRLATSA